MRLLCSLWFAAAALLSGTAHVEAVMAPQPECSPCHCPSLGKLAFNHGAVPVLVSAAPYPDFTLMPLVPFYRNASKIGPAIKLKDDGFTVLQDGIYDVTASAVLYNNQNCAISCTNNCSSVCDAVCATNSATVCDPDLGCETVSNTSCVPACNVTCGASCSLNCPTPMYNVFTIIDGKFNTSSVELAGSSNSLFAGGVVQYFGSNFLDMEAGDHVTVMIQNGVSSEPIDALVFAWGLQIERKSASQCACSSSSSSSSFNHAQEI
jgi:hypothetical protein